jgi:D-arabinose 1-dehydrogenase-like Zn-dependent alcohol dehydrogenase
VARRSLSQPITPTTAVYLADTLGELGLFYALSGIVFVGGSLRSVGGHNALEPAQLDCALIFAPVGSLVPLALSHTKPGGTVICAGIHMSDIPSFPYNLLWEERSLRSVANLTRADAREFLALAGDSPSAPGAYPLAEANRALDDSRRQADRATS